LDFLFGHVVSLSSHIPIIARELNFAELNYDILERWDKSEGLINILPKVLHPLARQSMLFYCFTLYGSRNRIRRLLRLQILAQQASRS
jgi:hypothetical protein